MVFDVHAHLYAPRWYPPLVNEHVRADLGHRLATAPDRKPSASQIESAIRLMTDTTGESTLRTMDKAKIDTRVVLIVDWGVELGEALLSITDIHREILGICRRSHGRLIGFAGVDPRRKECLDLVRWAFDQGARGLKLHPTGAWRLDDKRTLELVAVAASRGLPVLVHVGATMPILRDTYAQPDAVIRLARQCPTATFIAGHSGFDLYRKFVDTSDLPDNIYFDISGWQAMAAGSAGGMEVLDRRLSHLLNAFAGRVCFGTDSPFYTFNLPVREKWWVEQVARVIKSVPVQLAEAGDTVLGCPAGLRAMIVGS